MSRREYAIDIIINGVKITKVIIDPHFEIRHAESISDEIILKLVETLDGEIFTPEDVNGPFMYFATDRIGLNDKFYKLIWLLEDSQIYIGVVNTYRR